MNKIIENHTCGIILSSVVLPFSTILPLSVVLLSDTNPLFQEFSLAWCCLSQTCIISVASTAANPKLKKLLYGCSLLLFLMAVPINHIIAVAIPGVLLLVFGLLRLCKPVGLLVAYPVGVVVMTTVQCITEGMSFAVTSIAFLLGCYVVGWGVYLLGGLVDRLPEPLKRFVSEGNQ